MRRWFEYLLSACLLLGCSEGALRVNGEAVAIRPSLESVPGRVVEVRWVNAEDVPVRVLRARLEWPGGVIDYRPRDLVLPAGGEQLRTVRVELRHGTLPIDPRTVRVIAREMRRGPS